MTEHSTHALSVGEGGSTLLHSLVQHAEGSHLGTYYRIVGPTLIARLLLMGGSTPRKVAAAVLLSLHEHRAGGGRASHLLEAHMNAVGLQESFSNEDLQMAFLLAPRGLVIAIPGDPNNVSKELPPTVDMEVIPAGCLSLGSALGIKHVAAGIWRL